MHARSKPVEQPHRINFKYSSRTYLPSNRYTEIHGKYKPVYIFTLIFHTINEIRLMKNSRNGQLKHIFQESVLNLALLPVVLNHSKKCVTANSLSGYCQVSSRSQYDILCCTEFSVGIPKKTLKCFSYKEEL